MCRASQTCGFTACACWVGQRDRASAINVHRHLHVSAAAARMLPAHKWDKLGTCALRYCLTRVIDARTVGIKVRVRLVNCEHTLCKRALGFGLSCDGGAEGGAAALLAVDDDNKKKVRNKPTCCATSQCAGRQEKGLSSSKAPDRASEAQGTRKATVGWTARRRASLIAPSTQARPSALSSFATAARVLCG